jgi:hypothetical protein
VLVPIGLGIRGDVHIELYNTKTGLIDEIRDIRNTLLNGYINYCFNQSNMFGYGVLNINAFWKTLKIGTSDTAAARTDAGIKGSTLATVNYTSQTIDAKGSVPPIRRIVSFVFPAGTGTGTIKEVVIGGDYVAACARQVVSPEIVKTDLHELRVTWTISLDRSAASVTGTIPGGQRDGVTDVDWTATINNRQIHSWGSFAADPPWTGLMILMGDSNAASDLANDTDLTIKGNQIYAAGRPSLTTLEAYVANSGYRDTIFGFDKTEGNGNIGEIVICHSYYALARITFNPRLDKIDSFRLYIKVRLALVNMS